MGPADKGLDENDQKRREDERQKQADSGIAYQTRPTRNERNRKGDQQAKTGRTENAKLVEKEFESVLRIEEVTAVRIELRPQG